mgnify:FL=1|tara:strand:+ start:1840 stop:2139 length:300 start_codon:yes stop_codon:yes gene_type:complete
MKKLYFTLGLGFLVIGLLMYQSAMDQVRAFEEIIKSVEQAGNNARIGVERMGLSIEQTEEINRQINSTMNISRGSLGLGAFLIVYSTYDELIKLKSKFF